MKRFLCLCCAIVLFISLSAAQTRPIRFAWLSDTHVGAGTGEADLRASMHEINANGGVDFVILSGDVTESGKSADLELTKRILDSLTVPYYIIPGNHDTKWSESGCTEFPHLWGDDKFAFEFGGYRFIGLHEGPIMRMGDGHFAPEDLRWLDGVLAKLKNKRQPIIFVTHYPLDPGLDNWYELIARAKKFNTKVVLVGHGHANHDLNFEGIPGVMGRSNLRGRGGLGGYNIVTIEHDTLYVAEHDCGRETKPVWDKVPLETRNYRADTTKYERPNFSVNSRYPGVKQVWRFESRYTIASAPAVWKDRVIAGNSSGTVFAVSLGNGKKLWSFKTGATVYSSPEVSEGKVVFGSSDRNIYCLNASNGRLVWRFTTGAPVVAVPAIAGDTVYIGGGDEKFRALSLEDGRLLWEFDGVKAFVETKPLVYGGKVVFGAWDTYLYALNATTGALAWKWSNGNPGELYSPAACWPVGSNGKVFVVAPDRYMTALDAATGNVVWRTGAHQVREMVGRSEDGSRVYARCMTDTLLAFSPTSALPQVVWSTPCSYGYDIDPSMPIEKEGTVYFGTKNGLVIAVDGATGKMEWQHKTGVTIVNTPAPVDARRVVVTTHDGSVLLLEGR